MFKQKGGFWLYFVGIIIMFLLLFYVAQYLTGRSNITTKKSPKVTTTVKTTQKPGTTANPTSTSGTSSSKQLDISKDYYVDIETEKGTITVDLLERSAPNTVANFVNLANTNYYTGTKFYKLIPGVLIQGGSKTNSPSGGADYTIPDEINWDSLDYSEDLRLILRAEGYQSAKKIASVDIDKYSLIMANPAPNKASTQFSIILGERSNPEVQKLRGRSTVFGIVTLGKDVLEKIALIPVNSTGGYPKPTEDVTIKSIKIYTK